MLKVTSVDKRVCESYPQSAEINADGYILLPEDPDAVSYNVYAPLKGLEATGPWYWKKAYKRSEARRARFTVVGLYQDADLSPLLSPRAPRSDGWITLPPPMPRQQYWHVYGGLNHAPYAIIEIPEGAT